jgi:hypothetical protein
VGGVKRTCLSEIRSYKIGLIVEPSEAKLPVNSAPETDAEKACWTASRRELRTWLRRDAPSLAELYEGAVLLLFDAPIPGYTRFVAHGVREIRNRLPDITSGTKSGGYLDYKTRFDALVVVWKKAGFATDGAFPGSKMGDSPGAAIAEEAPLPREVVVMVASLVAEHEAARERPMDAAIRLFEGVLPENQKFKDTLRPVAVQWLEITQWFMKKTHDSGMTDKDLDLAELRKKFGLFELTLLGIVRGFSTFFATTKELDEILEDANS